MSKYIIVLFFSVFVFFASAQKKNLYDQHQAFNPALLSFPESPYRSAGGIPGPQYWQNRADYSLAVSLDTMAHTVSGTATITYTNNSPDSLAYLWFELGQDLFKKGLLTWRFKMANCRDVAWAASKAYIWDAVKVNLPGNKSALAMSV